MTNPIIDFIDRQITRNEQGKAFELTPLQREVLGLAFAFDEDGVLPWDTILYACVKKSGKTSINAAVTTAWAATQEAPNELYFLANDEKQARDRAYTTATKMIRNNPTLLTMVRGGVRGLGAGEFEFSTGTLVRALASEAAGAAGSNHGFTSWDELWGYVSEGSLRLWEEMTPVPTRKNSIRFITTYAGIEGESMLLWQLYLRAVGKEEHPDGQGERIHPTLPIYANREAGIFAYWDHEPRMPWQTPAYYAKQRRAAGMRPSVYLRLHENRWSTARTSFMTPELWDPCVQAELRPVLRSRNLRVVLAADAATKKDSAALVAVTYDEVTRRVRLVNHAVWMPGPGEPIDLEATIEATAKAWALRYDVIAFRFDPYQLLVIGNHLKNAGIEIEEFPQTTDRLTAMGSTLWDLVKGRNLEVYPDETVRTQALNTVAVETARGFKIAKDKATRKIDLAVALAMAAHRCLQGDEGEGTPDVYVSDGAPAEAATAEDEPAPVVDPATLEARERQENAKLWSNPNVWRNA